MIVLPSVCYEEANTLANLGHPYAVLGKRRQARIAWQQALALYLYLAQHHNDDAAGIEHRLADHRQD